MWSTEKMGLREMWEGRATVGSGSPVRRRAAWTSSESWYQGISISVLTMGVFKMYLKMGGKCFCPYRLTC